MYPSSITAPPEPALAVKKNHIGILDFLRGFAALAVLLFHYTSSRGLVKFYSPFLSSLFTWGNMGVEVFFVISGFIIPYSLWRTKYTLPGFFRFMAKRIIRIAPPAYLCMALILLQWLIIDHFIKASGSSKLATLSVVQVLRNILFAYEWQSPYWINPVFWTLAIEFQFYVIVGLFYPIVFKQGRVIHFVMLFVVLSLGYYLLHYLEFSIFGYAPLFAMGGATLLYRENSISLWLYLLLLAGFSIMAFSILGLLAASFGLATSLAIAFIRVQHPLFAFFGKISYSLYLIHLLVGSTAEFILAKLYHPKTELGNVLAIIICISLACGISYAYYKWIEIPFMRLAQRVKS